jgi:hypothetical protein
MCLPTGLTITKLVIIIKKIKESSKNVNNSYLGLGLSMQVYKKGPKKYNADKKRWPASC